MPDIKVPAFPESVETGAILVWHKQKGDHFARDEVLVEIETDKVVLEVPAPAAGVLTGIKAKEGDEVKSNQLIGVYDETQAPAKAPERLNDKVQEEPPKAGAAVAEEAPKMTDGEGLTATKMVKSGPAARRLAETAGLDIAEVGGSDGLVTKQDVVAAMTKAPTKRKQERVPMSRLRASIARRLVQSQQTAAMLTTFNEVNMRAVMNLRAQHKDAFEKKYAARLGFMSFFVRASIYALNRFPEVNAYIEGEEIVYHNYNDLGVAISSPRGLVVPVLRDAQGMDLASIEKKIAELVTKARDAKLALEELQGGTFTISNGGIFGSLMSTPIINPPQTAILGMHKIQERPMAVDGEVQILPMMYLALSYDHRMIDGKTAVQFLVAIKEFLEYPGLELLGL